MKNQPTKPPNKAAALEGDAALAEIQPAILNAIPAHIALLDADGIIFSVNEAWTRFAEENQLQSPDHSIGQNYLEICQRAAGHGAEEAAEVLAGLEKVLRGESEEFAIEYPCHSLVQKRWFRLMITPLYVERTRGGAVVMHINITERKLAELERLKLVHDLGERVKELNTLYEVTRLLNEGTLLPPQAVLARVVPMLPAAMQYPGITAARLVFGGDEAATPAFLASPWQMEQSFTTGGGVSGRIEVVYCENPDPAGNDPFLPEERQLLESLAVVLKNHFEQQQAVRSLRESEGRLRATFEQVAMGMAHVAEDGTFLRVNRKLCDILGYSEQELSSLTFATITPPEERAVYEGLMSDLMTGVQTTASLEKRYRRKDGSQVWVRWIATSALREDGARYLITVVEDISERRLAEHRLRRMNRLYLVLSKIAETIVRAPGLQELYDETCRVLVEEGGLKMALLVGLEQPSQEVRPLAAYGHVGQYLEGLTVTVDDGPHSRGTIGIALRTGCHDVCNDFLNDPRMEPWRESAARNGFGSTASFPLIVHEAAAGSLAVFAEEKGYFEADEIGLMRTVAADLSFAIEARLRDDARVSVEKALRLSQTNMAAAQRIAHFGSWELDLTDAENVDGNPLTWSDEMCRIAGFEPGTVQVSNELFFSLVPPEEQDLIRQAITAALRERRQYSIIHRLVRPDGELRMVHETAQLFFDDITGEPVKMIGTTHDITEQRQMAMRLEAEHARLAIAQKVGKVGSWETDIATLEVSWSEETHRIFETDPAAFQPTHGAFLEIVHPEDRERVDRAFVESLGSEGAHAIEHRLLMPDSRVKYVEERWQTFFDDQGRALRAVGTCQEITERKLAEQEIQRAASLLRAVVDGTPDAIYVKDLEGRYLLFNEGAARLVGKPVQEVLGRNDNAVFDPESACIIMENDRRAMESGRVFNAEEVLTASGVTRTYLVTKAPYLDGEGKVIGLVGISRDVSRRKRHEQQLSALSSLGLRLNTASTAAEAAQIISDVANELFEWDAAALDLYSPETGLMTAILTVDTLEGEKTPCPPAYDREPPSALAQKVLEEGAQLILRGENAASEPDAIRFGDTGRPSSSLMFVPIRAGRRNVGLLSIQSYRPATYSEEDLQVLQLLADYCGGALNRIQIEAERGESEQRLREMAENIGDIFYSFDPAQNRLLYANHAYERIWGRPLEKIYADPLAYLDDIHPEDCVRVRAALQRQLSGEQSEVEFRVIRPDGGIIWMRKLGVPILDKGGKVGRIVGTMRDITERKAAEERLREQAALLDKAQDAILVRDLEHHILYWNKSAARLYGWTEEEALGSRISQLLYHDPSAFNKATSAVIEQGEWTGEITQYTKAGTPVIVEGHWSLVRDDKGRPQSILAINTDITERKKIEQQYLRAQRMESIGTLAGGIAHDLNNVLAPIMMSIELLKLGEENPTRLQVLDTIEASARRGADMVRQVLSFARGVEGRQIEVRVDDLLREIEKIANETFLKSILVSTSIQTGLWPVKGDPTQLHQVLLNLCVNARDAMPEGGTLCLSAGNLRLDSQYAGMNLDARPGPHVLIQIEDTGSGMPPEILERIFEPFFTTKELGKGTGLGLSTSQAIIKSHGGFIRVYSELEKGTRFHVYLPALTDASAEKEFLPSGSSLTRGAGELVLLVDDEEAVRQITRQTLETFGYRVILASDGAEATALYAMRRHEIAVVITDMMMPIMDGPATIQVLLRMNPQVRIIAASGLNANSMVAKATNAGVRHFISKPYTAETLLTTLRQVLHVET